METNREKPDIGKKSFLHAKCYLSIRVHQYYFRRLCLPTYTFSLSFSLPLVLTSLLGHYSLFNTPLPPAWVTSYDEKHALQIEKRIVQAAALILGIYGFKGVQDGSASSRFLHLVSFMLILFMINSDTHYLPITISWLQLIYFQVDPPLMAKMHYFLTIHFLYNNTLVMLYTKAKKYSSNADLLF